MKRKVYHDIEIVDIAAKGHVIGKKDGKAFLLKDAVPGDIVSADIGRKRKGMLTGRIIDITDKSADRTEPKCRHFDYCGGCNWQNLTYPKQLEYKNTQVQNQLKRIGQIEAKEVFPIQGAGELYQYRNKLEFTFTDKRWLTPEEIDSSAEIEERRGLGFHVPGRFDWVMHITECLLEPGIHNDIRNFVFDKARELNISFFDLKEKKGELRNLVLRRNLSGDWMLVLICWSKNELTEKLCIETKNAFDEIKSVWIVENQKLNDDFSDCPMRHITGELYLSETFVNNQTEVQTNFQIGPKSFFQTNPKQAEKLYNRVYDWAEISSDDVVYDLYTGTGSIALFLARQAKKVVGIEYVPEAVEDARLNSQLNEVDNCVFYAGDMKDILTPELISKEGNPDVLIADPPRAGMHADVIEQILKVSPKRIIYVSCDPATQARDLALLSSKYEVQKSQAFDLFPHTSHVENIVVLSKRPD